MTLLQGLAQYRNTGLLIMRAGLGIMMILHGYPKLFGGVERWTKVGGAMANIGIEFAPALWGFMASATEAVGGLLVVLGLFFRPVCILMIFTMFMAAVSHFGRGDGLMGASHAIETGIAFVGLLFLGAGKYSIDKS